MGNADKEYVSAWDLSGDPIGTFGRFRLYADFSTFHALE